MPKKFITTTIESGCTISTSHKLNKDGYLRKNIGKGIWVMYHRHIWEQCNGAIPEGYEINHLCKNRACFNPEHLECISGEKHAIITNEERYAERLSKARKDWSSGYKAKSLSEKYGVDISCAYRWIREWRKTCYLKL